MCVRQPAKRGRDGEDETDGESPDWYEHLIPRGDRLVWIESVVYREYHWTPAAVAGIEAIEVIYHVRLIHEHDAERKFWELRIAAAAQAGDSKFVNEVVQDIRVVADFGKRRRNALELVDGPERLAMIGTLLKRSRSEWVKTGNADPWLEWLAEQGYTEADAVAASESKLREVLADPFWEE